MIRKRHTLRTSVARATLAGLLTATALLGSSAASASAAPPPVGVDAQLLGLDIEVTGTLILIPVGVRNIDYKLAIGATVIDGSV